MSSLPLFDRCLGLLLLLSSSFFATNRLNASAWKEGSFTNAKRSLEIRVANVELKSQTINRVHSGCKEFFGIQYAGRIDFEHAIDLWISGGYSLKKGESSVLGYATSYHYLPFGLGLKGEQFLSANISLSLGVGVLASFLGIKSAGGYVASPFCRWAPGVVVKGEMQHKLASGFFLGLFIDRIEQRFKTKYDPIYETCHTINFCGSNYGVVFGWKG